jgi:hypothetical protein
MVSQLLMIVFIVLTTLLGMHEPGTSCLRLITETAGALSDDAVAIMFISVQKENLAALIAIIVHRLLQSHFSDKQH